MKDDDTDFDPSQTMIVSSIEAGVPPEQAKKAAIIHAKKKARKEKREEAKKAKTAWGIITAWALERLRALLGWLTVVCCITGTAMLEKYTGVISKFFE